jgi:hypothetical protein
MGPDDPDEDDEPDELHEADDADEGREKTSCYTLLSGCNRGGRSDRPSVWANFGLDFCSLYFLVRMTRPPSKLAHADAQTNGENGRGGDGPP